METTKEEIRNWLHRAKSNGATHVIVVCDTFDHEDYPVEVKPGEDVRKMHNDYSKKDMQRIMEVYNLSMDFDMQLNQKRSYNF